MMEITIYILAAVFAGAIGMMLIGSFAVVVMFAAKFIAGILKTKRLD